MEDDAGEDCEEDGCRRSVVKFERGGKIVEHTGPPIAPRRMASALRAASRASSVRGTPVASIEACGELKI